MIKRIWNCLTSSYYSTNKPTFATNISSIIAIIYISISNTSCNSSNKTCIIFNISFIKCIRNRRCKTGYSSNMPIICFNVPLIIAIFNSPAITITYNSSTTITNINFCTYVASVEWIINKCKNWWNLLWLSKRKFKTL